MRLKLVLCVALLLSLLLTENAFAENQLSRTGDRVILFKPAGVSSQAASQGMTGKLEARSIADAFLAENETRDGLVSPSTQLTHMETRQDDLGLSHVIYKQEHHGVSVRSSGCRVHINQVGEIYFASAEIVRDLPSSVFPVISERAAMQTAEKAAREILPAFADVSASIARPRLEILPEGGPSHSEARLSWEVHVTFTKCNGDDCPRLGAWVGVDAVSGEVQYAVHDFHGLDRKVYDCSKEPNDVTCYIDSPGISGYVHGRSELEPVRGPHNNPAVPQFGSTDVDYAFDITAQMHNFVQTKFGLNGANNLGGTRNELGNQHLTVLTVHGEGWDGNQANYCPGSAYLTTLYSMRFCHGEIINDAVGHEYGHALAEWSFTTPAGDQANGIDNLKPSTRALSESHSDIMGEAFDFDQTGSADWIAGTGSNGLPWRDLTNPHEFVNDGGKRFAQRLYDEYFTCGGVGSGDYYSQSTVYSHAMYLASEGGEMNGCEIVGQGMEFVTQIYHRAWRTYFSRGQSFDGAYTMFMQSCNDLYDSTACAEFDKALQAVEANQAEAPYGGGLCDDPQGALGEQAPPCAVSHGGDLATTQSDASPDSAFQVSESVWISLANGTAGRTVDFALLPHNPSRPIWDDLAGQALEQSSGTLDSTGALFVYFFTPSVEDTFDVIVDGNQDGYYQPWADETATIVVSGVATDVEAGSVPTARLLQSVRPNPFNPTTTFSLRLAETTRLRLTVFTSVGRQVRTLVEENALPPGSYSYDWDGQDNSGKPVASGIYLYRIESARGNELGKVTLVR